MIVTSDFEGGNAKISEVSDERVLLEVELRDTQGDWFFWCFKVTGAAGKTVKFEFPSKDRVGYYGAAVSYDRKNWHWQYDKPDHSGESFTYTFSEDENEVYFAHDMVYRPERFFEFAKEQNIDVKTLCVSEKGREVPYIDTEKGDECILLTARHHACESTGSYVLEGVLENIVKKFSDKYRIICIPFVDYDGVIDGDQGKNRNGHDHNRDYAKEEEPIYSSTSKIREIADNLNIRFAFDFHSPWHLSGDNDTLFIPIKSHRILDNVMRFSSILEGENSNNSLPHYSKDNLMPDEKWNSSKSTAFGTYMASLNTELSFTLETPYYIATDVMFTAERAKETGICFVKAFEKYLNI